MKRTGISDLPLHGGKPLGRVDKPTYDRSIEILRTGIEQAKLGEKERLGAIRRLGEFYR